MTKEFITVLIPTYNRAALLLETLDSVFSQTRQPDEIIILNDGCTDHTVKVLRELDDRIRVLSFKNQGKSGALNSGLQEVGGGLIWIVDDDDLMEPAALETLENLLIENPDAGFSYGRHGRFSVNRDQIKKFDTGYWCTCRPEEFFVSTMDDMFAHQPGMLVRKSLYDQVGPFETSLARSLDYEMLLRLARVANVASTDEVIFWQRVHDGERGAGKTAISSSERNAKWIENDQIIFRKLYAAIELKEYIPSSLDLAGVAAERYALLRRGVIMARKKLWVLAVSDFRRARDVSNAPLTNEERQILRSAFAGKYGCEEIVHDQALISLMMGLKDGSRSGFEFTSVLGEGLLWRVRYAFFSGQFITSFKLCACMLRLKSEKK